MGDTNKHHQPTAMPKIKLRPPGSSRKESSKGTSSKIKEGQEKKVSKKDIPMLKGKEGQLKKTNRAEARLQKFVKTLRKENKVDPVLSKKESKEKAAEVIGKYCSLNNLKVKSVSSSPTKQQSSKPQPQIGKYCSSTLKDERESSGSSLARQDQLNRPPQFRNSSINNPKVKSDSPDTSLTNHECFRGFPSNSFKSESSDSSPATPPKELRPQCKVSFKLKVSPSKLKNPFERTSNPSESSQNQTHSSSQLKKFNIDKNSPYYRNYVANTYKRKLPSESLQKKLGSESDGSGSHKTFCSNKSNNPVSESHHSQRLKKVTANHLAALNQKGLLNEDNKTPLTSDNANCRQYSDSNSQQIASSFDDDDDMQMDWEPIPEELVISDIHSIRAETRLIDEVPMEVDMEQEGLHHIEKDSSTSVVHLVIDTNVLISNLVIVKDLITSEIKGMRVQLVIPWQVLRELDHLKNRNTNRVGQNARTASNYLLSLSLSNKKTVYFQSRKEELSEVENFSVEIADDQLLKCCLQLQNRSHNVVLLTNDQNLRLKCAASKIVAASCQEIMRVRKGESSAVQQKYPFEAEPSGDHIIALVQEFSIKLNRFLTNVLVHYLKDIYCNMWIWFAPSKPPWRLKQTIGYAIKLLPKLDEDLSEHSKYLRELDTFFSTREPSRITPEQFKMSLEKCKSFCRTMPFWYGPTYAHILHPFHIELEELISMEPAEKQEQDDLKVSYVVSVFQDFEDKFRKYCEKLSELKTSECMNAHEFQNNIEQVSKIIQYLNLIHIIPCGKITAYSHGIAELHALLLSASVGEMFTIEAVVSFCNDQGVRSCLPSAIQCFDKFHKTMKTFAFKPKS